MELYMKNISLKYFFHNSRRLLTHNWSLPSNSVVKLNVYAHSLGDGCWGFVLKKSYESCFGAPTKLVRRLDETLMGKILGLQANISLIMLRDEPLLSSILLGRAARQCGEIFEQHRRVNLIWIRKIRKSARWVTHETNRNVLDIIQQDIAAHI
jgi:hypothetical protein